MKKLTFSEEVTFKCQMMDGLLYGIEYGMTSLQSQRFLL